MLCRVLPRRGNKRKTIENQRFLIISTNFSTNPKKDMREFAVQNQRGKSAFRLLSDRQTGICHSVHLEFIY